MSVGVAESSGGDERVLDLERVRVDREEGRGLLLGPAGRLRAADEPPAALLVAVLGPVLAAEDDRAVGGDRQLLVIDASRRDRTRRWQIPLLEDRAGVAVEQHDLVAKCVDDLPVREDVEVGAPDERVVDVQVLDVCAPHLLPADRVDPGHEWAEGRGRAPRAGGWSATHHVHAVGPVVVDVVDVRVVALGLVGVDDVRLSEGAEEVGAGIDAAALAVRELGAVQGGEVARGRDPLLAVLLLGVEAEVAWEGAERLLLARGHVLRRPLERPNLRRDVLRRRERRDQDQRKQGDEDQDPGQ